MDTSTLVQSTPPLRTVREANGLSLRELARRTEIDVAHLSRVERGQAVLSVRSLARVAEELGLRELTRLLSQYDISPASGPKKSASPPERATGSRNEDFDGSGLPPLAALTGCGDYLSRRTRARRRPLSARLTRREGELERGFRRVVELDDERDDRLERRGA